MPGFEPKPLITREMLKKGNKSELGIDDICEDIFNDLKCLFFPNDETLKYDEVVIFSLYCLCYAM